jgi:hypothetical protein
MPRSRKSGPAAIALAGIRERAPEDEVPGSIEAMILALEHGDHRTAWEAACQLGRFMAAKGNTPRLVEALGRALDGPNELIQRQAAIVLAENCVMTPAPLVDRVVKVLTEALKDEVCFVQEPVSALVSYREVLPTRLVPVVVKALMGGLKKSDDQIVAVAAWGLTEYVDRVPDELLSRVVRDLASALDRSAGEFAGTLEEALYIYSAVAPRAVTLALIRLLKSKKFGIREYAARELALPIVPVELIPCMVTVLAEALERGKLDSVTRTAIDKALSSLSKSAAVPLPAEIPAANQVPPQSLAHVLNGKRPRTLERMLQFAELWRDWPVEEATCKQIAEALSSEAIGPRVILVWKVELERLTGAPLARLTANRSGLRFCPGARERLDEAILHLRLELDRHARNRR